MTAATHLDISVTVLSGDLDPATFDRLALSTSLAWDIETTGLDWQTDDLATVQIRDRAEVVLVEALDAQPEFLRRLLEAPDVPKLFHHAMFDLRFMAAAWDAARVNVACTKVAAKLLRIPPTRAEPRPSARTLPRGPDRQEPAVVRLARWFAIRSPAQVRSGRRLVPRRSNGVLARDLEAEGRWALAEACFTHIPVRVALEVAGFDDVFVY